MATREVRSFDERSVIGDTARFLEQRLLRIDPNSVLAVAWAQFYATYSTTIRRLAAANQVPTDELDDCVQETWLAVIRALPSFDLQPGARGFRSWLFKLVRSKATDQVRRFKVRKTQPIESQDAVTESNPATELETKWNRELVHAILDELRATSSESSYRAFYLRRIQERSVEEVSIELGLTKKQVYWRIHRMHTKFAAMVNLYTGRDFGERKVEELT